MESPFRDNFEEDRKIISELKDKLSYEEQKKELLWDYLTYRKLYRDMLICFILPTWLTFRSHLVFPTALIPVQLDIIIRYLAVLMIIVLLMTTTIVIFKFREVEIKYCKNERSIWAFIPLMFYEPYDYEEKPKSVIPFKKIFLYTLYFEICIDSFFIIDYLFN